MRKDAQNHLIVFDQYESDYYTTGTWPWVVSGKSDTSGIQDIWDNADVPDNPGIQDEGYEPIGIGYLGEIG